MDLDFTLLVTVTFFAGKRRTPPCLSNEKYRPHLVVKGDSEYLGVYFIDGPDCHFDQVVDAAALPIYPRVGYDKLAPDTEFFIMEGCHPVGAGTVREIFLHQPLKQIEPTTRTWQQARFLSLNTTSPGQME